MTGPRQPPAVVVYESMFHNTETTPSVAHGLELEGLGPSSAGHRRVTF